MRRLVLAFSILLMAGLTGCSGTSAGTDKEDKNTGDVHDSLDHLNLVDSLKYKYQEIEIDPVRDTVIRGQSGINIYFEKGLLQFEDGSQPSEPIRLRLLELIDQSDFAQNAVQTASDGQLLESGGAWFIEFISEGRKLFLKKEDSLKVLLPRQTDEKMSLFYGVNDSRSSVGWISTGIELEPELFYEIKCVESPFPQHEVYRTEGKAKYNEYGQLMNVKICDTVYKKVIDPDSVVYQVIHLSRTGWISSCRYIENPKRTDLIVRFSDERINIATIYLIYMNYNSVVMQTTCYDGRNYQNNVFHNVLLNEEIMLVAIARSNEKLFAYQTETLLSEKSNIVINFSETTRQKLESVFSW